MKNRWVLLGVVVTVGVVLDQVSKQIAEQRLTLDRFVPVIEGFFALRLSRNQGAFFSLGESMSDGVRRAFFIVATLGAIALIGHLYRKAEDGQRALRWALALLLAGAVGNLIDRVLYGSVIDFLHLHLKDVFHWATFNFADIYITFGLVFLLVDLFRAKKPAVKRTAGAAAKEKQAS